MMSDMNPAGEIFLGEVLMVLAAVVFFSAWFVGAYCLMIRLTVHSGRPDVSLAQIEADLGGSGQDTTGVSADRAANFHPFSPSIADEEQERAVADPASPTVDRIDEVASTEVADRHR
ncbi:hypothetical protein CH282_15800 [Rhodococcus sp. 06-418-1B]|nr:hypothetical protein [Rhodococcus sp. 06-418-1B]OZC83422.1 hypothetical protein CH282_15800 [Rhodococcus sp. 06-418-1B]